VDFSKRLSRVAAIATWGGIALALVGAVVLREHHDAAFTLHFYAFLGWQALAVLNALALSALPTLHGMSAHVRKRITTSEKTFGLMGRQESLDACYDSTCRGRAVMKDGTKKQQQVQRAVDGFILWPVR